MVRRPPRATVTVTLVPYPTLGRSADCRERFRRDGARRLAERTEAGRRDHVLRLLPRRRGPTVQSSRKAASHVRWHASGAAHRPQPRRRGRRLRLAAFDGRERTVRTLSRLADRRADDPLRLYRPHEYGNAVRRSRPRRRAYGAEIGRAHV